MWILLWVSFEIETILTKNKSTKYSNASNYDEKIMSIGRKIIAGIALVVAAMVVKKYMKKKEKERNETDRQTDMNL
jgi:hypothetical protein